MPLSLSMLANKNMGELKGPDCQFGSVSTDTRQINAGELFVAIRGERFDGHDNVADAEAKGACALVVEHEVESSLPQLIVKDSVVALGRIGNIFRSQFNGKVVEITGSCGKTAVKGMLREICQLAGSCVATQGNFNNHIGVPLTLFRLEQQVDYAVVEAGTSEKGEICYLTSIIDPDIAVVNNVMPAHVEGFGSVEAIAQEKSTIYNTGARKCICVVNLDDTHLPVFLNHIGERNIIAFGKQSRNLINIPEQQLIGHVAYFDEKADELGRYSFHLIVNNQIQQVKLATIGKQNINNALAASACAVALGIDCEQIVGGLQRYQGDKGRMQLRTGINSARIIDDSYNANPGSFKPAIEYLSQYKQSILVCGDMAELGSDAISMHEDIGRYAKNCGIARVFATGKLAAHTAEAYGTPESFFSDKERLIEQLKQVLAQDSVVLIKGSRSAKMEEVVEALQSEEERQPC